ncbi:MAG: formate dehydrogenase accessory protein FdhE [Spirochaetes bacterium]|nr:MAG: formate dehydrogenase accessory protein FdhE [Spirochaetota bacterium]
MQDHGRFFSEAEARAREEQVLPADSYEFYQSLFNYQTARCAEYAALVPGMELTLPGEPPFLVPGSIALTAPARLALASGLGELLDLVGGFNTGMNFDVLRDADAGELAGTVIDDLLARDLDGLTQRASALRIGFEELVFVVTNWIKPFMASLAEPLRERFNNDEWLRAECPVCGYYPDIARIAGADDGRRFLHCALCETEWVYTRLHCAVCGNSDTESMGYFTIEGDARHRIDYCDACKGYLKTVIINKFQEPESVDLSVENVLTAGLDAAAMEKGYSRP